MPREKFNKWEERGNAISHGLGAILALFGLFLLLKSNTNKTIYATFGIVLYSLTLISMFMVSSLYHAVQNSKLKRRLRILDHIAIYFLIAGTYTPLTIITLESGNGWYIFCTVWGIAALGTVLKLFYTGKYEVVSLLLYLAMGWLIVIDFENLMESTTSLGIWLLFIGGAFYTLGILFYAWERIPYNHFIWHLFVLGGAIGHWFFIYKGVI
ncbi:hemolysin III family protein [Ulvibacterium sp.]|uniref:PAQR family membrane homeostasis protein TrhA n=1 Tax=Ulvibacterium sp. TaxID=2665914 RepID=UPI0026102566|nr:hemolysin III family protein [Ulvibacterium sp.]